MNKGLTELFKYGKARLIVLVYGVGLSFLFIDIWNWKYWQFALWFIPLNFIIGFYLNRKVFKPKVIKNENKNK